MSSSVLFSNFFGCTSTASKQSHHFLMKYTIFNIQIIHFVLYFLEVVDVNIQINLFLSSSQTHLTRLHITYEGTIEDDGYGMLQVCFLKLMRTVKM